MPNVDLPLIQQILIAYKALFRTGNLKNSSIQMVCSLMVNIIIQFFFHSQIFEVSWVQYLHCI